MSGVRFDFPPAPLILTKSSGTTKDQVGALVCVLGPETGVQSKLAVGTLVRSVALWLLID